MARSRNRTEAELRARADYARRSRAVAEHPMPSPTPFFIIGGVIAAAGVALLGWLAVIAFGGEPLDTLLPTVAPDVSRPAMPGAILLVGGSILFLGEMFRSATWHFRQMDLLSGGATTIRIRRLRTRSILLWMLAPAVIYLLLIPVPILLERPGSAPSGDFWLLSLVYGFVAAGFVGLFLTSFVRRASYGARRGRQPAVAAGERRLWRVLSVQWRIEHWFGFAAAGFAGILPLSLVRSADSPPVAPDAVGILLLIAIGCAVVSVLTAVASPRSGYAYGEAESVV